jgi:opacity protein-like surface antigen
MTQVLAIAIALSIVLGVATPARAEWFAGIYLGFATTSDTDVTFTRRTPHTWQDVEFGQTVVWGGRAGYWFGEGELFGELTRYMGVDLDVSYFRPRIEAQTKPTEVGPRRLSAQDISVVTFTPEVLLRYPLMVDQQWPMGRLQPYVAFGPTIFFSSADDNGTFGPRGGSESDRGLGVVFRPGIAWQMTDAVALFAEYRFVHVSPRFEFTRGPVDLDINSHHINLGVSYTFGR